MTTKSELSSDLVVLASRLLRQVRRVHDLPAGTRVLSILDEQGPLSVTELAVADRCSQPTMSSLVAGLVANGWVSKDTHPDDARRSVVDMTATGREELDAVRRRNGDLIAATLRQHTTDQLATAVGVLRAATLEGAS